MKKVKVELKTEHFFQLILGIILVIIGASFILMGYFVPKMGYFVPGKEVIFGLIFSGSFSVFVGLFSVIISFNFSISENIKMAECLDPNKINEVSNVDIYDEETKL